MDAMNTLFSPADATMLASASPAMGPYGKQQQQPPPPLPPPPQQGSMTADEGTRKAAGGVINGPFYVMRELPGTELTANNNLITHYNLEHAYNKFCGKKVKDKLSNFIPDLPGMIDLPGSQDNSSLRSLIEKPPICGNSFTLLTGTLLTGFRLHTGPLPEQYRLMHVQPPRKKNRHKHKHSRTQDPVPPEPSQPGAPITGRGPDWEQPAVELGSSSPSPSFPPPFSLSPVSTNLRSQGSGPRTVKSKDLSYQRKPGR
ncbi:mediator of RNA polymerase II transcription subunit 19-like isoform X2 [Narcine bancroftii]|uniref:mediator of RNA polymerase II transcription subunit 19-like isoform X2 n=1 Tax=Narcine bancroftii TaxID=1343680 RepID=UPI003831B058